MRTIILLSVAVLLCGAGEAYKLTRDEDGIVRLRLGEADIPLARGGIGQRLVRHGDRYWLFLQHSTHIAVGQSKRIEGPYLDHNGRSMLDGGGTLAGRRRQDPPSKWLIVWPGKDYPVVVEAKRESSWTEPCAVPVPFAGPFDHWADGRGPSRPVLAAEGKIPGDRRPNRWVRDGRKLVMTWPRHDAPGGKWIDNCLVSNDNRYYVGRNQAQTLIFGHYVDAEDTLRPESRAYPAALLPKHVLAPPGQLTLFADPKDVRGDRVVLYLVNRTDEPVTFDAQDGDIFIKLEGRAANGKWDRAQRHVTPFFETGTNAKLKLRPDRYFMLLGRYPAKGERRKVRYRMYEGVGLTSNPLDGHVDPGEVLWCRVDDMGHVHATFDQVVEIGLAEVPLPVRDPMGLRCRAISELLRFRKDERTEKVLRTLLLDPDSRVKESARTTLHRIKLARSSSD